MHGIKLFRLMLRDLKHLHSQDAETVFLKLLDDVADRVLGDRVRFDNSKSTLQSLHSWVVCPRSLVLGRWSLVVGPWSIAVPSSLSAYAFAATPIAATTVSPISAGDLATRMPAASIALIFSAAVPFPPEMIAPAWPMRRPEGAV